jgi:hypothetical protein
MVFINEVFLSAKVCGMGVVSTSAWPVDGFYKYGGWRLGLAEDRYEQLCNFPNSPKPFSV